MAITLVGQGSSPLTQGGSQENAAPRELSFREKLKQIADNPSRELSIAEKIAVSAPGRWILGGAEKLGAHPVSRGIVQSPINVAETASDLYLGVTQKGYEAAGFDRAARETGLARRKARGVAEDFQAFQERQDELYSGGETAARVLRNASTIVTDSLLAAGGGSFLGGGSKGNALFMQYYATKSTQDALKRSPGDWQNAISHGLIDGISIGYLGEVLNVPTSAIAGVPERATAKLLSRTAARVAARTPLPEGAVRAAFGVGTQAGNVLLMDSGHYFADVAAGIEKLDWGKYAKRMEETALTAGVTGAAAGAIHPVVEAIRKRQEIAPKILQDELVQKNKQLVQREFEAGLISLPEVEVEPGPRGKAASKAEIEAQQLKQVVDYHAKQAREFGGLTLEKRLFDVAIREQRLQGIEKSLDTYTTPKSVAEREVKQAVGKSRARSQGQAEKAVEPTPGEVVDLNAVRDAPLRAGETKPEALAEAIKARDNASRKPVDMEFDWLEKMESEAVDHKQMLLDDSNVQSPAREQLMQDLEGIQATIAERLTDLANQETATPRGLRDAESRGVPPRSKPQARLDALHGRMADAMSETRSVADKLKAKETFVQSELDSVLEPTRDVLPGKKQAELQAAARKVKTPAQLLRFTDRVNRSLQNESHKRAVQSLRAAKKKADAFAADPEVRGKIDDVITGVDTSLPRVRQAAKDLADYVKNNPQAAVPEGYKEALSHLEKKSLKELTPGQIRQMAEALESVAATAATGNTLRNFARHKTAEQYASDIVNEITAKRSPSGTAGEIVATAANIHFRPEAIMESLSGLLRLAGYENLGVDGHREQLAFKHQELGAMTGVLRQHGLAPDRVLGKTLQGGSALNEWRYEIKSVGGVRMTRGEAAHLYALSLDPQAWQALKDGGAALSKTKLLSRGASQIEINDGTLREATSFIGEKGVKIVEFAFSRMNKEQRNAINAVWIAEFNRPLSQRENYFPMRRDNDWALGNKSAEDFIAGFMDSSLDSYGEFGITKRREAGVKAPVQVGDFFDVYGHHIDTVSRITAYTSRVRDFARVYQNPAVKRAIVDTSSRAVYDGILEAARQQVLPVRDSDGFSRTARKLVHGSGVAILGFRVATAYKNALGLAATASLYDGGEVMLAKAMAKATVPRVANATEARMQEASPLWNERYHHYMHEATSGIAGESRYFQPSSVADASLKLVSTTDKFAGIARAIMVDDYLQNTLGLDPQSPSYALEHAKEWERSIYRTETTSHGMEMSGALRAGRRHGLVGSLVQFQSGASKTLSLLQSARNDIREGRYKRGVRKTAVVGANVYLDAKIGAIFATSLFSQEEEMKDKVVRSATQLLPGYGDLLDSAYRRARGVPVFGGPPDSVQRMMVDAAIGVGEATGAFKDYLVGKYDDEGSPAYQARALRAADKMSLLIGSVTHIPTEGAKDLYRRFADITGIDGKDRERLAKVLTDFYKESDTTDSRNKLKASLLNNDDALFLEAVEEINATNPKGLSDRSVLGIVNGMFSEVARYEKHPELALELSDSELRVLRQLKQERQKMFESLRDMVQRNQGQLTEIVGGNNR